MKERIKKVIPVGWLSAYHKCLSIAAAVAYGFPSRQLIVVGVTGTKGKSTTSNMLWKLLTDEGHTVGLTGTVNYRIGGVNELSTNKMTMPGRFQLQKYLRRMVVAGCDIAIVETTSEGIKQWRHFCIAYDVGVFTNLTPEHLDAHGGFEGYKKAKLELFRHIARARKKVVRGLAVRKFVVVNADSEYAEEFAAVAGAVDVVRVGRAATNDVVIGNAEESINGTRFDVNGTAVMIPVLGAWNADNCALAMGVALGLSASLPALVDSARTLEPVPGRMEFIDAGQPFSVIVDYAYEPKSLELLFRFCRRLIKPGSRLITLVSSTGGGRDVWRRPENGRVAAELCDFVIVTDEDPYDDDPQEIIDQVAAGAVKAGKVEGANLWRVRDRRDAIKKALKLAQPGDVVLLTAKGAEQRMAVANGRKIPWDDRAIAREFLVKRSA